MSFARLLAELPDDARVRVTLRAVTPVPYTELAPRKRGDMTTMRRPIHQRRQLLSEFRGAAGRSGVSASRSSRGLP
jgi:DNA-directed RNA polymerase specialized sigma24 family protein